MDVTVQRPEQPNLPAPAESGAPPATSSEAARRAARRGTRLTVASFSFCFAALAVATVVMSSQFSLIEGFGIYLWSMVVLGALIMMGVLAAILVPYLKEQRQHQYR